MKNLKIEISPDVLSQEVSGETVLLDIKSESYFGLDPVGTRIWELLQEYGDLETTYKAMLDEYDVEAGQLVSDLTELVGKLEEAGLINTSPTDN